MSTNAKDPSRRQAAHALHDIVNHGKTLDQTLLDKPDTTAAARAIVYDVLRHYFTLTTRIALVQPKAFRKKDRILDAILLVGAYQLTKSDTPPHAVVNECVSLCNTVRRSWARGAVNAMLRKIAEDRQHSTKDPSLDHPATEHPAMDHPDWLFDKLSQQYPTEFRQLCQANNRRAPMALRINSRRIDPQQYRARLDEAGIGYRDFSPFAQTQPETLFLNAPIPQTQLPGYAEGLVSVQDAGAQLTAGLLTESIISTSDIEEGTGDSSNECSVKILDACSAPGGKMFHLVERFNPINTGRGESAQLNAVRSGANIQTDRSVETRSVKKESAHSKSDPVSPTATNDNTSGTLDHDDFSGHPLKLEVTSSTSSSNFQFTAVELSKLRLQHMRSQAERLGHANIEFIHADAREHNWAAGQLFDAILLDAPCSGTGTLRRHPDIKVLRTPDDLPAYQETQQQLLHNLWQMLKPGGTLVYCTCSILADENDAIVKPFLTTQADAKVDKISLPIGQATAVGWQLLPSDADTDGFYYARLRKVRDDKQ